jgi:hypothetical protein
MNQYVVRDVLCKVHLSVAYLEVVSLEQAAIARYSLEIQ